MGDLIDIQDRLHQVVAASVEQHEPEGLSVFVVTEFDALAIEAAPLVAHELHPSVPLTGKVLWMGKVIDGRGHKGFEVVLEVQS